MAKYFGITFEGRRAYVLEGSMHPATKKMFYIGKEYDPISEAVYDVYQYGHRVYSRKELRYMATHGGRTKAEQIAFDDDFYSREELGLL